MSTEEVTAPVLEVPPKDNVVQESSEVQETQPKSSPIKRLSTIYSKAKTSVTDTLTSVQRSLTEKKTAEPTTVDTEPQTTETNNEEQKTDNNTVKNIITRIKSIRKPSSTNPATDSDNSNTPPVPPPKDNVEPSTNKATNPVVDQFKRNTTQISNYLSQKKKQFTTKKSPDTTTETPEVNEKKESVASPLTRRFSKLVDSATATINKTKEQLQKHRKTETSTPVEPIQSAPVVTAAA